MRRITSIADLEALRRKLQEEYRTKKPLIIVCGGAGCRASGSMEVVEALEREIKSLGLENKVYLKVSGCHGFCERGPIVVIHPEQIFYQRVKPDLSYDNRKTELKETKNNLLKIIADPVAASKDSYKQVNELFDLFANSLMIRLKNNDYFSNVSNR